MTLSEQERENVGKAEKHFSFIDSIKKKRADLVTRVWEIARAKLGWVYRVSARERKSAKKGIERSSR